MDASTHCTMCRICMQSDSKMMLIGLFKYIVQTETDAETLANVVSLVGAVEVQQDDELPKHCCTQCLREVEAAYKLRNLCQESDIKLRRHLSNTVPVVKKEPINDDELNSRGPEGLACSIQVCSRKEVVKLNTFAPEALKQEYEEITIEDNRLIEANYNNSDHCSEGKDQVSDENCSNNQELEADVCDNNPRRINYHRMPEIFDKYPAVKLGCCRCISSFDTIEELRAHGREKHRDTDLEFLKKTQCDICFTVLANRRAYIVHKRNVMYNYRCQICDQIMITLKQAYAHCRLKHKLKRKRKYLPADQALTCCGCEIRFASAEALKIHSETIHLPEKPPADEKKPVTCNICYRNYASKRVLRMHEIGYLKRNKNHHCNECGKSYRTAAELRYHEHSHMRKAFPCSQCPKVYFHYHSLKHHLYLHSQPSDKYRCNECGQSFQTKATLTAHSRNHTGERPYQCTECEKSFKTQGTLNQHTRIHAIARPFSCPQCPATFKQKGNLKAHVTAHSGNQQYACPQCDRQFHSRTGMTGHIRSSHDKVKPYVCTFCSKGFTKKYLHIKHLTKEHPEHDSKNPNEVMPVVTK